MITEKEAIAAYKAIYQNKFMLFSLPIANAIGIKEAIIIKIVEDWCKTNNDSRNAQYYKDKKYWTRLSYPSIAKKYPCLGSDRCIQKIILKLETLNILISDNFNRMGTDRTKWYRVNQFVVGKIFLESTENKDNEDSHDCKNSHHGDCGNDGGDCGNDGGDCGNDGGDCGNDDLYVRSKEKRSREERSKKDRATTEKAEEEVFFAPDRREDPGKQETPSLLAEENRDEDPGSEPEARVDPEIPAPNEEKAPPHPPQYMDTPKEDIRFDKKIPFSGDLNSACYRQEMRFFNPQLPDLSEGAVHTLQTTEGKTLLCLLNEKGLDPIARIEGFLRFYFDQNLADNSNYKGKPYDGLTQAKVATAIASKIRYNDTGVLIQTISEFKKRIEGPKREFIKIMDEKPEETPELIAAKEKGLALIRAKIEQNRAKTPLKKAKTPLNEETIMLTLLPAQNANKTAISDQSVENLSTFVS